MKKSYKWRVFYTEGSHAWKGVIDGEELQLEGVYKERSTHGKKLRTEKSYTRRGVTHGKRYTRRGVDTEKN